MYNKKNVVFVALLWENFMFQADNRDISTTRKENMPYPRFTKVIINHFISKDKTISIRNWINIHIVRDDSLLGTLKFVSNTQDYQKYGALIPEEMINQSIKDSKAYKIYLDFSTRKATPKKARKFKKVVSPSKKLSSVLEEEPAKKPKQAKKTRQEVYNYANSRSLLEATRFKKALKKSKQEAHKLHASGSGDGVGSQPKVPDESQDKITGDSEDDNSNDDDSDDVTNDDDDVVDSDADGDNEASDSERTDSDEDKNPNLNQNDDEEEEYEEEYLRTPDNYEFSNDDDEYEDVNVRLKDAEHEKEGKGDADMTDVKTEGPMQSSSVSSDFARQFLNLDNVPPVDNEFISMMNVKVHHEEPSTQTPSFLTILVTVIPETSIAAAPTIPPKIPPIAPLPQQSTPTPTPAPTTDTTTTSILALLDFSSLFDFDQRSQIPAMINAQHSTRLEDSIQKAFRSYTTKFEKKAQGEKQRYIDLIEKSVKDIIKDEVKSQLPQILPKEVSDYATLVIQRTITESFENVLAKSSSQPKSTYEAATSLTEFELKKILLDKMQKSKSYQGAQEYKELYDGLVKSYKLDKDLFESYGKAYSLKRDLKDKDKDEDPPAGSNQGLKIRKTSKDVEPSKGSKLKESKSSSSKSTKSQPKSSGKSTQAEESVFETATQRCHRIKEEIWNNPKGHEYPFDLSKPLPLIEDRGRQVVLVGYFINNDLEYLKGGSSSRKYTTSTTKTKAAKYDDIQGIEDMVPSLWSPVKVDYDRYVVLTHVKVIKWYDYGYLKEIEVRREDQKHYKFKEGDFPRLNLCDIEDMLLLLKKLNVTKPETFRSDISKRTPYTAYNNPQRIIYVDKYKGNRLMRSDELYKFSDGTLTSVRSVLHDIASNLRMDYLPKRRWSNLDKQRSRIMIKAIDKL
ncbi:hypothetical protein Tco_1001363 [Tanacetum coccineum]